MITEPDLDLCPKCGWPTFGHELVMMVNDTFYHQHCADGSVMIAKLKDIRASI